MAKFNVVVREVHTQIIEVIADDKEAAIAAVKHGQGTAVDDSLEYSHTLDSSTWTVDEAD